MSEEIKKTYIRMLSHTIHYDCCYNADADNDFEKISDYITNLQQKVEQLENENFNIRENIHLERISLPPELTKDKDFMELYDIPSYEDLKNKVEQLVLEIERLNNIIDEFEKWLNELGAWCYVEKIKELKENNK